MKIIPILSDIGVYMIDRDDPVEYGELVDIIKQRILTAQNNAFKSVNWELISLYWDIGKAIVDKLDEQGWGSGVVDNLARDLQAAFPGIRGFSAANLWRMRLFYKTYCGDEKLAEAVREIGWSHNVLIMEKCNARDERGFYVIKTASLGWSRNVLAHQIENRAYEKTIFSQTNFSETLPEPIAGQIKLSVKDEYTFDFLELGDSYNERQLEDALLARIEPFLREMGGVFAFVGSQYRLEVSDKEYFLDLLLYHRRLKCLVAIELKIGEFMPEYIGKMQFYLAVLDDTVRMEGENPSIGIIICKSKDKLVVEYALRESNKPIGVATYRVVARLPEELEGELPGLEQVEKLFVK